MNETKSRPLPLELYDQFKGMIEMQDDLNSLRNHTLVAGHAEDDVPLIADMEYDLAKDKALYDRRLEQYAEIAQAFSNGSFVPYARNFHAFGFIADGPGLRIGLIMCSCGYEDDILHQRDMTFAGARSYLVGHWRKHYAAVMRSARIEGDGRP